MNMKIKLIYGTIFVISILTVSSVLTVSSFTKIETEKEKNIVPKIYGCYNTIWGNGEKVKSALTNKRYDFLTKNEINTPQKFEIDWGDGTTTTTKEVDDQIYIPHIYKKSGMYVVKAKYLSQETWSEEFELVVEDFFDLVIENVYTKPEKIRPGQKIKICADIKNTGTKPFYSYSKVRFFERENRIDDHIADSKVGAIEPGDTKTVEIDYKWPIDKKEHTIHVKVFKGKDEIDYSNNDKFEYFSGTGLLSFNQKRETKPITMLKEFISNSIEKIKNMDFSFLSIKKLTSDTIF